LIAVVVELAFRKMLKRAEAFDIAADPPKKKPPPGSGDEAAISVVCLMFS
jgi:hypothetical protein